MAEQDRELEVVPAGATLAHRIEPPGLAPPAASVFDLDPSEFRQVSGRREENRQYLLEWIREHLVDGTPACYPERPEPARAKIGGYWKDNPKHDPAIHAGNPSGDYGRVYTRSGWSKPGLWKTGAEKIWGRLGVTPHWPALADYERAAVAGARIETIVLRCVLIDGHGAVQAEGCGGRTLSQDGNDINKAIKMAKKSGAIDAVLAFGGLSELFTQDFDEDTSSVVPAGPARDGPPQEIPTPATTNSPPEQHQGSAWESPIGFGKYGDYSYKELVDGGSDREVSIRGNKKAWCAQPATLGGGRYSWLEYLISNVEKAIVDGTATPLDMSRLEYFKKSKARIDAREGE